MIYHLQEVRANVDDRTVGHTECSLSVATINSDSIFVPKNVQVGEKSIMILSCIIHPHGIILNPVIRWLF